MTHNYTESYDTSAIMALEIFNHIYTIINCLYSK